MHSSTSTLAPKASKDTGGGEWARPPFLSGGEHRGDAGGGVREGLISVLDLATANHLPRVQGHHGRVSQIRGLHSE